MSEGTQPTDLELLEALADVEYGLTSWEIDRIEECGYRWSKLAGS